MPGDRPPRLLGLAAKLGELLPQPADDHRLIGAEPQRLGLVQVGRPAQLAEDPPRLVLGSRAGRSPVAHAVLARLLHRAQPLPERFDLVGGVEQHPGRVELAELGVDLVDRGARRVDGVLGQPELILRLAELVAEIVAEADHVPQVIAILGQPTPTGHDRDRRLDPLQPPLLATGRADLGRGAVPTRRVASR